MKILPAKLTNYNKGNMINRKYFRDVQRPRTMLYGSAGIDAAVSVFDFATSSILGGVLMGAITGLCVWLGNWSKKNNPYPEYEKIVERAKSIKAQRNISNKA